MVREECNKLEPLDYFNKLDFWTNRVLHREVPKVVVIRNIRRHENVSPIDEARFSILEINRILVNK